MEKTSLSRRAIAVETKARKSKARGRKVRHGVDRD